MLHTPWPWSWWLKWQELSDVSFVFFSPATASGQLGVIIITRAKGKSCDRLCLCNNGSICFLHLQQANYLLLRGDTYLAIVLECLVIARKQCCARSRLLPLSLEWSFFPTLKSAQPIESAVSLAWLTNGLSAQAEDIPWSPVKPQAWMTPGVGMWA